MLSAQQSIPLGKPTRTATVQGSKQKVNTVWPDGTECVEEYDIKTDLLVLRQWRRKTPLGALSDWEIEVGDVPKKLANDLFISSTAPVVTRLDTKSCFEWRIRNLVYPKETYHLTVEQNKIVVRTVNKKYFCKLGIPDMDRLKLALNANALSWDWGANTLVIQYKKPMDVLHREEQDRLERKKMEVGKEGDVDCKPS